ncbi:sulfate/molybdate ABC transporter ATP-binding protein [Demequina muriae]|uniref:ATP-binding cassette domain-containing protein n=1 Tax=Demequina muriae TaxID=3051664 RepID=A0ABT8GIZ4_9MICO|nr:ATP-binding cassette domain-containing protein [Demequina sp. EGI L300058]MDN4481407.1 ATP-binding cassette domain-containing protein [Demequina sp. EGI L300058]
MLTARVVAPARGVDATISAEAGRTLALLGPNGSGKSTLLAAIAGLVRPAAGAVTTGTRVLHDLDASRPVWRSPRERRVGLVTQGADLFPTMTVLDNVAFGPRSQGAPRADAREQSARWLDSMGLGGLADRRPASLSGGQHRQVAIARALASAPDVLALDEPFAGIDVEAASQLRTFVASFASDLTVILTTHDPLDVHLLAHDVAVLDHGSVVERGTVAEVLTRPRTGFAARMAGMMLLHGTVGPSGELVTDDGIRVAALAPHLSAGQSAVAALRPRAVRLAASGGIPDVIRTIEPRGDVVRVHGERLVADIDPASAAGLLPGASIAFDVPPVEVYAP